MKTVDLLFERYPKELLEPMVKNIRDYIDKAIIDSFEPRKKDVRQKGMKK